MFFSLFSVNDFMVSLKNQQLVNKKSGLTEDGKTMPEVRNKYSHKLSAYLQEILLLMLKYERVQLLSPLPAPAYPGLA